MSIHTIDRAALVRDLNDARGENQALRERVARAELNLHQAALIHERMKANGAFPAQPIGRDRLDALRELIHVIATEINAQPAKRKPVQTIRATRPIPPRASTSSEHRICTRCGIKFSLRRRDDTQCRDCRDVEGGEP